MRQILVYAAAIFLLTLADPESETFLVGTLIVIFGIGVRIWSFGHLEKNQFLTTTGPYAHSRNPAYVGSALILTGLFVAAGTNDHLLGWTTWILGIFGLGIFFAYYMPRKYRNEYQQLSRLFPEAYAEHASNVSNFWPRLRPWRSGDGRRFSWQRLRLNHEAVWPVACLLALSVMWI